MVSFSRLLKAPDRSFFLFGPRGVGKSTWLRQALPDALRLDLLDASVRLELTATPNNLGAMNRNRRAGAWIVLDEIQKAPLLLDEVQRLMADPGFRFALCGSSARKLKRGGANLLAGRAVVRRLGPFSAAEIGEAFDPEFSMNWGMLPAIQCERADAEDLLRAYVNTYIKGEIREEGLVRREPPFLRFLPVAGILNGQAVNMSNVAREAAIPRMTVENYFAILTDTLLGEFLPAWRPNLGVRETAHPKFYWFDPGVARAAAGRLSDPPDRASQGGALETLVLHELKVHNEVAAKHRPFFYYRTAAGVEIDFVIETRMRRQDSPAHVVLVEVKRADRWDRGWERGMRALAADPRVTVDRMIGVYTGARSYRFDGLDVLPFAEFLPELHRGEVF